MFDSLSTRLQDVFASLRGAGRLTLRTSKRRSAKFVWRCSKPTSTQVVKAFVDRVRDRAMEDEVLRSLSASQQVVKIVRDEMLALFGDAPGGLSASAKRPRSCCCSVCKAQERPQPRASWRCG